MRVLLTTDTIGGVWTFTQELSTELLRRGHRVALLSFGRAPSASQSAWCARILAAYGSRFRFVSSSAPLEWMACNERAYSEALPALHALAEEFRPDLLHSSQFCFGDPGLPVPVVITAHSDVLSWAAACRPVGLDPSPWLDRYCALVERGLAHAAAVVAPSRWMGEALSAHFRVPAPPRVIFNGRSLSPLPVVERSFQAVSVGRFWDEAKNLALLADVQSPMPILVAGEQHFDGLPSPGPTGTLTMLGALAEHDLLHLFARSSVYLASSRYEPFGLAPLEAAQCGCALLLHDLPSFREIWGEAALYFEDAASLSALLASLSPAAILAAQTRSRARALQLTAGRMAEQYEALYREVLVETPSHAEELGVHVH